MAEAEDQNSSATTSLQKLSRRSFLSRAGAAGLATAASRIAPSVAHAEESKPENSGLESPAIPGTIPITLKVNGSRHSLRVDPRATVLDTLRETLHLTGTKKGCDHGQCGACTIHLNGRRANSCLLLAAMQQNAEITTIEGLGSPQKMAPMQAAFVEHDGYQCGYCTSGQIMSAVAVLKENVGPTDADVKQAMYGNICRCGAYSNIVAAVQQVRHSSS